MEGRSRFVLCVPNLFRNPIQGERSHHDGYWTGSTWEIRLDEAKTYVTRAQAESDLFLLVIWRHDLIGRVEIVSYIEYGPQIPEELT